MELRKALKAIDDLGGKKPHLLKFAAGFVAEAIAQIFNSYFQFL